MSLKPMTTNEQAAQRLLEINKELVQIAADLAATGYTNKSTRKPEAFAFDTCLKKSKNKPT